MTAKKLTFSLVAVSAIFTTSSFAEEIKLDDIVVNADLRQETWAKISASINVMSEIKLQDQGATHFEDVLFQIPNINYSGQNSRPRHIQIRGMGERDDYTGAPNASVGFAIDDIDFSGIGMAGSLFDVKQVEVLRGSQATRYGATAIAGLVNIRSNEPSKTQEGMLEITAGEDNLREFGTVISGPFNSEDGSPLYRLSVQKHDSDGFRHNTFLNRDNTNGRDELNIRGKLRFTPNSDTQIDLTLLHADLDNGYDAWSLDNTFVTHSDEPGKDTQKTTALAVKVESNANEYFKFTSTTTLSRSDMTYGYDGDWAYSGYHATGDNTYVYNNDKDHKTLSQEFRFLSTEHSKLFNGTTDWLIGFYGAKLKEKNHTTDNFGTDKQSEYDVAKLALFGQLDYALSQATILSAGVRIENFSADYTDSYAEAFDPSETMFGGHLSLSHQLNDEDNIYIVLSQGYKAGGFSAGLPAGSSASLLSFKKETATSLEAGFKRKTESLDASISAFYISRNDPQFDGYTYIGANYAYYTENFDKATNYGVEAEFNWKANSNWNFFGSFGLLKTTVEGVSLSGAFAVNGREQAHAPKYQFSLGGQYRADNGFFVRGNIRGMDEFYFSNSHDEKSKAYSVADARIGYESESWEVYVWGKNIFDKKYATRGFYFANEPTYSINERYIRLGDPQQFGITARYHF